MLIKYVNFMLVGEISTVAFSKGMNLDEKAIKTPNCCGYYIEDENKNKLFTTYISDKEVITPLTLKEVSKKIRTEVKLSIRDYSFLNTAHKEENTHIVLPKNGHDFLKTLRRGDRVINPKGKLIFTMN